MVLPGYLHLSLVQAIVKEGVLIGAQNCGADGMGAFTGEVAADHIKDYQIDHVLIGHHERRRYYNETQEIVSKKVKEAEDCQLNIVYCCGEEPEHRKHDKQDEVLSEQL